VSSGAQTDSGKCGPIGTQCCSCAGAGLCSDDLSESKSTSGMPRGRDTIIIARHQKADYYADAHAQHESCKLIPAHRALPLRRKRKKSTPSELILDTAARLIVFSGNSVASVLMKHSNSRVSGGTLRQSVGKPKSNSRLYSWRPMPSLCCCFRAKPARAGQFDFRAKLKSYFALNMIRGAFTEELFLFLTQPYRNSVPTSSDPKTFQIRFPAI